MRRRDFVKAAAVAAVTWPLAARAQQPAMPVIGFLHVGAPDNYGKRLDAYRRGLQDSGFVEGRNVAIEYRWAEDKEDRLPGLAADLIKRQVTVIATPGSTAAALAAKAATATIPIVFSSGADPVALGLVPSLSHPGGNVTGITALNADLASKKLSVLRTLLPKAQHFLALINPTDPLTAPFNKDMQAAVAPLGIHIDVFNASNESEIDAAFAGMSRQTDSALIVSTNALFFNHLAQIIALAAQRKLPAIYDNRESTQAGGLISYGTDFLDVMRQTGVYTARVLKGEKPADLPIMQETKFEMVINLKSAKALGLEVPPQLLSVVDEVIE